MNSLRHNVLVEAWIEEYQKGLLFGRRNPDCWHCGWPHHENLLCGAGSTFGLAHLGGETYAISSSNVDYMVKFVTALGPGYHWKNDIYFNVEEGNVIVSHIESYNNCPHVKKWTIPLDSWQSITRFVKEKSTDGR